MKKHFFISIFFIALLCKIGSAQVTKNDLSRYEQNLRNDQTVFLIDGKPITVSIKDFHFTTINPYKLKSSVSEVPLSFYKNMKLTKASSTALASMKKLKLSGNPKKVIGILVIGAISYFVSQE
jgi:hypothetical protein